MVNMTRDINCYLRSIHPDDLPPRLMSKFFTGCESIVSRLYGFGFEVDACAAASNPKECTSTMYHLMYFLCCQEDHSRAFVDERRDLKSLLERVGSLKLEDGPILFCFDVKFHRFCVLFIEGACHILHSNNDNFTCADNQVFTLLEWIKSEPRPLSVDEFVVFCQRLVNGDVHHIAGVRHNGKWHGGGWWATFHATALPAD